MRITLLANSPTNPDYKSFHDCPNSAKTLCLGQNCALGLVASGLFKGNLKDH